MTLTDFPPITVQLIVADADAAVRFYREAFGADELVRNPAADGKRVLHCELLVHGTRLLLHDEFPEQGHLAPTSLGGTSVTMHLYVADADAVFERAVEAGATVELPVQDAFWGDRYGILRDPAGHRWSVATPREDPAPSELRAQADAYNAGQG
ncbi:VOC family protein [Actinophytocola xanthii]|uniref:Glyoxalase n=1 Tax=Actinophytocola xanthii TaxID=1912961 RepID=A0A1Q8CS96_9PSEU|nr:VOC family protein [Actinophytocola xanthii]OLF17224.1 glyoxalase [Actinophytocola xanthii]